MSLIPQDLNGWTRFFYVVAVVFLMEVPGSWWLDLVSTFGVIAMVHTAAWGAWAAQKALR